MKKYSLITLLFLTACSVNEMKIEPQEVNGDLQIRLGGEIVQEYATRANDSGFANGDEIGIYVVDFDGTTPGKLENSGNRADNLRYTFDESTWSWIPDHEIYYKDNKTHIDIYGYYPYSTPVDVEAWEFEVRKNQADSGVDDTSLRRLFYYSVSLYGCMSCRFLVRPFVPMPELLTEEEKSYYKPHVFDSLDRQDYELDLLNIHGLRNPYQGRTQEEAERSVMCWNSILSSLAMAEQSYRLALQDRGADKAYIADSIRRLECLAVFLRTLRNCCRFQAMLDRAKTIGYSVQANSDVLEAVMRDEYDNVGRLIALLEDGGAPLLPLAASPDRETTFLFGPDLAGQLRKKQQIMRKHWRDSQVLFQFKNRFNQI